MEDLSVSNGSKMYVMDARALKISQTMRERKLDNFKHWRDEMKKIGKIKSSYPALRRSGDLAELIGVILGDGHIEEFPRTERLLIFSNSNNPGFVKRYTSFVEKIFNKKPYVYKQSTQNCIRISLYEKEISKRLGIPTGSRKNLRIAVPEWILNSREYSIRYLRGLFEAEGSYCIHLPTCTYKFSFANTNIALLKNVQKLLTVLGFSSHSDRLRVQISKKAHVMRAVELLEFRKY